jgi:hypothetical protein
MWRANRFTPFAHARFGGARERTGMNGVDFTSPQTDRGFVTILGGGVDLLVNRHVQVRVIEADQMRARLFGQTQNSFGLSSGIIWGFAAR